MEISSVALWIITLHDQVALKSAAFASLLYLSILLLLFFLEHTPKYTLPKHLHKYVQG